MSFLVKPLTRIARRHNMDGAKAILTYIAVIVTISLVLTVVQSIWFSK